MLETERIIIRQWVESDRLPFCKLNADPETLKFFPKTLTYEESNLFVDKTIDQIEKLGYGLFALELKSSNEFIGFTGITRPNYETHFTPCTEIGWRLDKAFWGNGYATEAALCVLNFAFNEIGKREIVSFTSKLNIASIKVMQRIGMKRDLNGDFDHPNIDEKHRLSEHVLYRIQRPKR